MQRADTSLYNALTGLGGSLDKGAAARPNADVDPLTMSELTTLWLGNGIARRIVALPARELTRKGWKLDDGSQDTDVLADVPAAQMLPEAIRWGTTWARLHGNALGVLVTTDDVPVEYAGRPWEWLSTPLDRERVVSLDAIHVFDATEIAAVDWERDTHSPGYRLPSHWSITPRTVGGAGLGWRRVHASRLLLFRGAPRPPSLLFGRSRMLDDSVLQAMWDEIRNLTSIMQGGATLAQELRTAVLKIKGLRQIKASEQFAYLLDQIREMIISKSMLGVVQIGEGDEYINQSNAPTGFSELSTEARTMLAAVAEMPQTLLYGETPGGLSTDGESSRQNWDRNIAGLRGGTEPLIEQTYRVIFASQAGPEEPEAWKIRWLPLDEPTETEEAAARKTRAETDAIYVNVGVLDPDEVRRSRFGPDGYQAEILPVEGEAMPEPGAPDLTLLQGGAGDAADTAAILAYLSDGSASRLADLRAAVEAITGPLDDPGPAHVTVLYLGAIDPGALPEVAAVMASSAASVGAVRTRPKTVGAFPPGADGTPIVLRLDWAWGLEALHDRLLRQLAHVITARQHDAFRPHVTIGYLPRALSGPEAAALLEIEVEPDDVIGVAELALTHGPDLVVASVLLSGVSDAAAAK